jgi:hypothetical protein
LFPPQNSDDVQKLRNSHLHHAFRTVHSRHNDRLDDSLSATFSHGVTVVDDDTVGPTATITTTPTDLNSQIIDATPRKFEWVVGDDQSDAPNIVVVVTRTTASGTVEMFRNNNAATAGQIEITQFGLGTFTMTVAATDRDNDRAGDSITTTTTVTVVAPRSSRPRRRKARQGWRTTHATPARRCSWSAGPTRATVSWSPG